MHATLAIGASLALLAGIWAARAPLLTGSDRFTPQSARDRDVRVANDPSSTLDPIAFDIVLWHEPDRPDPPPAAPAPAAAKQAPDPLATIADNYEIIAIVQSQPMAAVIYDKNRDELQRAVAGFPIASGVEVRLIEQDGIVIALGERTLRMTMPLAVRLAESPREASP